MNELAQIHEDIGSLKAGDVAINGRLDDMKAQQNRIIDSLSKANEGITKLCTIRKMEKRAAFKIAGLTGGGTAAVVVGVFKWLIGAGH